MTAELLFSRMLLDLPMTDDGIAEVTEFLSREQPDPQHADLYYWYYASLSMLNMQNPKWKDWNVRTRESLIQMQRKDGPSAGCWDTNVRWAERGGRIFTTAIATLTLEVYFNQASADQLTDPAAKQTALDKAADFATKGIAASATKPAAMSDTDFTACAWKSLKRCTP